MRSLLEKLRNRNWLKSASCWMLAGREKKMSLLETWVATRSGQNPQGDAGAASVFRCHTVPRPLCREPYEAGKCGVSILRGLVRR